MGYGFHKEVKLVDLPNGIKVHWAFLTVRKGPKKVFLREKIPTRATLYKLITFFYFDGNFNDNVWMSIDEEDLALLQNVFDYRQKYKVWKECLSIKETKGTEKAKEFFLEKAKLFGLLKVVRGE